ncbi:MAG: hypothetical protein AB7F89_24705, partial [Pirellulaceae bacterium]
MRSVWHKLKGTAWALAAMTSWLAASPASSLAQPANPEAPAPAPADPRAAGATGALNPVARVQAVIPWEYSRYRVRVWIAACASPELGATVRKQLLSEVQRRGDAMPDAPWHWLVSAPPESLAHTVAYVPESLTDAHIAAADKDALKDDKIIWISLRATPRDVTIRARELDCHARTWSPVAEQVVRQSERIGQAAFDAAVSVFAPLLRIEEGQGKTCIGRNRTGGLITEDSIAYLGPGDVLQPIFRQNDRYGEPLPNRVQALPFTFLHVVSQDAQSSSLLTCNVHSGMRTPIHGRGSARRERWALKVRPVQDTTLLHVVSRPAARGEPSVPLAGLEVYAKTPPLVPPSVETEQERLEAEKRNPPELLGITDWRGSLQLPRSPDPLRLVYIKNGGLLLARLPMVIGLDDRLQAEVPDDNPRLQAEGFVRGMSGEIMDLVVQRQLIRVRFQKRLEEGKLDDAQKLLDDFRGLKSLNDMLRTLDQQMTRQKPTNNPAVRQRVEKLYADEREMIAKYVDVELLNMMQRQLSAARANPTPAPKPAESPAPPAEPSDEKKKELP